MRKLVVAFVLAFACMPVFAAKDATLNFYQRQALMKGENARADRAFASALAEQTGIWIKQNPQSPELKTALLMQADYYLRAGEEARALVALYQVRFYFPSAQDFTLLSSNIEQAMEKIKRSQKGQALKVLAVNTDGLSRQLQQAALLEALVKANLSQTYQPVNELFEDFFATYPQFSQTDKMLLLQGDWYRQNENYTAAVAAYKRVNELFPNTPYKAASLRMTADVYSGDLEDYDSVILFIITIFCSFV